MYKGTLLVSKEKRFPKPEMVLRIIKLTKGKVSIKDLYEEYWKTKGIK